MEAGGGSEPSTGNPESGNGVGKVDNTMSFVDFTIDTLGESFEADSHCYGLDFAGVSTDSRSLDVAYRPAKATNNIWDDLTSKPMTTKPPESDISPAPMEVASYDCEAEGFTALHSLHSCTMMSSEHPGELQHSSTGNPTRFGGVTSQMPPLDKVLYFNRSAVNTLKELLNGPGAQQPHLALLYMTIASKVLFWYRLVVSPQFKPKMGTPCPGPENAHSSISGHVSMGSTAPTSSDRAVKPVSIQIGVFDLEDEDQKLLMKGVLLREVRKLESVVDKLKNLGETYSHDEEYHDEEHISSWYAMAGSKMQAEVQDTLRQIKEFGAGLAKGNNM